MLKIIGGILILLTTASSFGDVIFTVPGQQATESFVVTSTRFTANGIQISVAGDSRWCVVDAKFLSANGLSGAEFIHYLTHGGNTLDCIQPAGVNTWFAFSLTNKGSAQ